MFLNNSPTPLEPWKSNGQGTIDWPTAQVFQSSSTALVPKGNLAPPRPRLECLHPRSFQDLFFPSLSHSWCLENQEFMEEYGNLWQSVATGRIFTFIFQENVSPERCRSTQINSEQLDPWDPTPPVLMAFRPPRPFTKPKRAWHRQPRSSMDGIYMYTPLYIYIINYNYILRLLYTRKNVGKY